MSSPTNPGDYGSDNPRYYLTRPNVIERVQPTNQVDNDGKEIEYHPAATHPYL